MLLLLLLASAAARIHLAHRQVETNAASTTQPLDRGLYVVQFRSAVDSALLRRLTALLGYKPTEYVPPNSLVLYFNSSVMATTVQSRLSSLLRHIEPLAHRDRRADVGMTVHRVRSRNSTRAAGRARRGRGRTHNATSSNRMTLHVRSFYASQSSGDMDEYRTRVTGALAACAGSPVVRIDAVTRAVSVHEVDLDDTELASDALLEQLDDVYWIDALPPYETHNEWLVPAVHRATDAEAATPVSQSDPGWAPLLGLRGAGQIVAISDTGVETSTCLFSDGQGAAAGSVPTVTGLDKVPADSGHPRIRAYSSGTGGDLRDIGQFAGHGTHTAGILSGRAAVGSSTEPYNGMAPDARYCIIDMLPASATTGDLFVPPAAALHAWAVQCGASVHSMSYGSDNGGTYSSADADLDLAAWTNRQLLMVVAAGNAGPAEQTISSPGVAKNALTVTATMNGIYAFELAAPAPAPATTYADEELASFASRGSSTMPFAKPDLAAPGGQFVWSALNTAPLTGSCSDPDSTTTGYAGTSMATPAVAAAGALVYEAFELDSAANGSQVLARDGGGGMPVYASLVRAMLLASGRSLDGVYADTAYDSPEAQRNAEGYGRVALDRVLGPSVALSVLSNERSGLGFTRSGSSLRACVGIAGLAANASLSGYELVLQLAYTDYPSSLVGTPSLVNDLDLHVTLVGSTTSEPVNDNTGTETRSTNERVIVSPAAAVDVQIIATTIGYGTQTFSLIAVLRPITPSTTPMRSTLTVAPLQTASGVCAACGGALQPSTGCPVCGNGIIETGEQCEPAVSGDCCASNCQWAPLKSICSFTAGMCRVQGRCTPQGIAVACVADSTLMYAVDSIDGASGTCQQQTANATVVNSTAANVTSACTRTVADWFSQLRASGLPTALADVATADLRICCQDFALFAFTRTPIEPVYFGLASAYIAARLNAGLAGVVLSVPTLSAMSSAKLLLESRCGTVGFTLATDRATAAGYTTTLLAFINGNPCPATPTPDNAWCSLGVAMTAAAASADLLCSGSPNRFIAAESRCECGALRQPEPTCSNLACSAHGSSIFDPESGAPRCICLPGWTGSACDKCATDLAPVGSRMLCVGSLTSAVAAGAPTYLLRAVPTATVAARLDGTYYARDASKTNDTLPGFGALDCWCRRTALAASDYVTHAAAVADASSVLASQLVWSDAATPATRRSGAAQQALGALVFALALVSAM